MWLDRPGEDESHMSYVAIFPCLAFLFIIIVVSS